MAWTYNNTTTPGVLTSAGATEASPDSLLAGIAIVQAADATRGYRNGLVAWLQDVRVLVSGTSFIAIDVDSQIDLRGSAFINPQNGGVIHDWRSTLIISTTTSRVDATLGFGNGSTFICRRQRPNDPSPRIVYNTGARHDYPNIQAVSTPAKVLIDGLDCYGALGGGANLKIYFGRATVNSANNVRLFNSASAQQFSSTYNDFYFEQLKMDSEGGGQPLILNRPTYYRASPDQFNGAFRGAIATLHNPTFLNNCWNGGVAWASDVNANSRFTLQYSYKNTFRSGLAAIEGVNVRFTRARQSITANPAPPTWAGPAGAVLTATSDAQGQYTAVNLMDAYRAGSADRFNLERFNWTLKARKYDQKTAGETVFTNRVLFQHSVNMSAGYSEEVQMLAVPHLTLTQAQATALTGISFVASGATGGTVTISSARTVAELWQAYRAWISTTANFDSEDAWSYDGTNLVIGAWTISGVQFLTGGTITTTTATAGGAISNIIINGDLNQNVPTNLNNVVITGTLTYNTNDDTTITITDTTIGTVVNLGTGIITINKVNSTIANYTDTEINFIDSTISVIGADTVTFHPTANYRDLNINASDSFSGSYAFKFGSTINGSTMSGTLYLRCVAGGIPFNINKVIVLGDNLVDLGTTAQLASLSAKIDLTAKQASLAIVYEGVKKVSQFKPVKTDL